MASIERVSTGASGCDVGRLPGGGLWPRIKISSARRLDHQTRGLAGKNAKRSFTWKGDKMAAPLKVHPVARANIARAYFAGGSPTEIGESYGVSPSYVYMTAKAWEKGRTERLLKSRRMAMNGPVAIAPAVDDARRVVGDGRTYQVAKAFFVTRGAGSKLMETCITLPLLSIQAGSCER